MLSQPSQIIFQTNLQLLYQQNRNCRLASKSNQPPILFQTTSTHNRILEQSKKNQEDTFWNCDTRSVAKHNYVCLNLQVSFTASAITPLSDWSWFMTDALGANWCWTLQLILLMASNELALKLNLWWVKRVKKVFMKVYQTQTLHFKLKLWITQCDNEVTFIYFHKSEQQRGVPTIGSKCPMT